MVKHNAINVNPKIKRIPISDVVLPPYNYRTINDRASEGLKVSLGKYGYIELLVVNERNSRVIAGRQRYKILKSAGVESVPVILVDVDETQERAMSISLNNPQIAGTWTKEILPALEKLREELKDDFINLQLDALRQDILDKGIGEEIKLGLKDPDEVPPLKERTDIKPGQIFQLGNHRLICGNAKDERYIKALMNKNTAKLCFTSPPYNMASGMYDSYSDDLKSQDFINLHLSAIKNVKKYLHGFVFWNVSYNKNARWEFLEIIYKIVKDTGLRYLELIIWDKGHALPICSKDMLSRQYEDILLTGDKDSISRDLELFWLGTTKDRAWFNKKTHKGITNYWKVDTFNSQSETHKACFPVALPIKGILLMTNPRDIVIDIFGGRGSTLISCEQTDRICYMMEFEPIYCQNIIDRWEEFTGKKAKRITKK